MAEPRDSHNRCPNKKHLVDRHYGQFLACDPMVQCFFLGTDVRRHKESMRTMHMALLMFDGGDELATQFIEQVARKHGPSGMNIPAELYEYWLTSLIEVISECDPAFNPEVERAWREVGARAVKYFVDASQAAKDGR